MYKSHSVCVFQLLKEIKSIIGLSENNMETSGRLIYKMILTGRPPVQLSSRQSATDQVSHREKHF